MQFKDQHHAFLEKLKARFSDLGFPKSTVQKITRMMQNIIIKDNVVSLLCQDEFYKDHIFIPKHTEIDTLVKACWGENYKFLLDLEINSENKGYKFKKKPNIKSQEIKIEQTTIFEPSFENQVNLSENNPDEILTSEGVLEHLNFSNFVVCHSNYAAFSAARSVAEHPGNISNPLFIYGSTGLGKTHLLHCIGNELLANKKRKKILYISSSEFVNDVIHRGIRGGKIQEIRKKYKNCDVLLFDDIQFFENKEACQTEFFHIFNDLYLHRKQIIITSDKFPKDIPNIEERLQSRFLQGLLVDIDLPNYEDRIKIIEKKLSFLGISLNEELIALIANHAKTNIREIEGILKDLFIMKDVIHSSSKDHVNEILNKRFPTNGNFPSEIDVISIQKAVSQFFQIKHSELVSSTRQKKIVFARHIAMFLAKDLLNMQASEISFSFGKKDHTTALHAISKIKETLKNNPETKNIIQGIKKILNK